MSEKIMSGCCFDDILPEKHVSCCSCFYKPLVCVYFFFITDQAKEKDPLYIQYVPGGMSFSRLTVSTLSFLCQTLS